jgi:hypothetical protein
MRLLKYLNDQRPLWSTQTKSYYGAFSACNALALVIIEMYRGAADDVMWWTDGGSIPSNSSESHLHVPLSPVFLTYPVFPKFQ